VLDTARWTLRVTQPLCRSAMTAAWTGVWVRLRQPIVLSCFFICCTGWNSLVAAPAPARPRFPQAEFLEFERTEQARLREQIASIEV
jgi:hypothetical protein